MRTYPDLIAAVGRWLHRNDAKVTGRIPDLIGLAEVRINGDLRTVWQIQRATLTTSDGRVLIPADVVEIKDLLCAGDRLEYQTITASPAPARTNGLPSRYAMEGNAIHLDPKPSGPVTLEMAYYSSIPALSNDAPTNWLLERAPNIYLYGALVEAMPFLREDERLATWGAQYLDAINKLQSQSSLVARGPRRLLSAIQV